MRRRRMVIRGDDGSPVAAVTDGDAQRVNKGAAGRHQHPAESAEVIAHTHTHTHTHTQARLLSSYVKRKRKETKNCLDVKLCSLISPLQV